MGTISLNNPISGLKHQGMLMIPINAAIAGGGIALSSIR